MKKNLFFTFISFLFLIACSSQQEYSNVNEAIMSLEKNIQKLNHLTTKFLRVLNLLAIN